MAKAIFQRNQKVWVESVGAWAQIEKVQPVWAKGFDEPVRITYDVGLNREFMASELQLPAEDTATAALGDWRVLRARNKWQEPADCAHHPFPGSYPVVVTDKADWGGWRVPGAEYDRDPERIEFQSRLIAAAPDLLQALQWYEAKAVQMGRAAIDQDSKLLLELMKEIAVEYGAQARAAIAKATGEQP